MKTIAALSMVLALATAKAPDAPGIDAPPTVRINSVGYAGTGCPQGSAYATISDARDVFTILFDSYVATIGGSAKPQDQRKGCALTLKVAYPSGYQFSIFKVRTQGYINTDPGVTGQVRNSYFFSGDVRNTASSTTNIPGDTHGSWSKADDVNNYSSVRSPCGAEGVVTIQTSIALQTNNRAAQGYISADSIDGGFDQKLRLEYPLAWYPCGGSQPQGPSPPSPFSGDDDDGPSPFPAPAPFTPPAPAPFTPPSSSPFNGGVNTGIVGPVTGPAAPFTNPYAFNPYASNPYSSNPYASNPYASNPFNPFNPYAQTAQPWTTVIN